MTDYKPSEDFNLKTHTIFGINKAMELNQHLKDYKNIGIVIDKHIEQTTYWHKVYAKLSMLHIHTIFIYEHGEPTYQLLDQLRKMFEKDDVIIGVGGGSVIDFAKGLAFLAHNPNPALSYRGFPTDVNPPTPVIAVPTTAGSGSDVTFNAVFIDAPEKKKLGINTKLNFPSLAVLDPTFLQSCPKNVMASSGMDALTHSIEAWGAKQSNPITRSFSSSAMKLLIDNLPCINTHTDINVCSNLMFGAWLAGAGLMNSGSGPAGAFSYILGANFGIPHGLATAVFLPHLVDFNESHCFEYPHGRMANTIYDICNSLDIPYNDLSKIITLNDVNKAILFTGIEHLQAAFDQNPVPFTIEDAKKIVRTMI